MQDVTLFFPCRVTLFLFPKFSNSDFSQFLNSLANELWTEVLIILIIVVFLYFSSNFFTLPNYLLVIMFYQLVCFYQELVICLQKSLLERFQCLSLPYLTEEWLILKGLKQANLYRPREGIFWGYLGLFSYFCLLFCRVSVFIQIKPLPCPAEQFIILGIVFLLR